MILVGGALIGFPMNPQVNCQVKVYFFPGPPGGDLKGPLFVDSLGSKIWVHVYTGSDCEAATFFGMVE